MEPTVRKAAVGRLGRHPQDTDRYIGARMRERRIMLGLTQLELAELIGVTFQQMHKYETGLNRISAGRLYPLAQTLGVEVGYFYQEVTAASAAVEQLESRRLLLELVRNYLNIPNPAHQKAISDLARALKDQDAAIRHEADPRAS